MPSNIPASAGTQSLAQTSSRIGSAQALAEYRTDKTVPHYRTIPLGSRLQWLGQEISKLNQILHRETVEEYLTVDVATVDDMIMDDIYLYDLTLAEISEAWQKGTCGAYGEFYGLNPLTLLNFLRSYLDTPKKVEATKIVRRQLEKAERQMQDDLIRREVEKRKKAGYKAGPQHDIDFSTVLKKI